MPEVTPTPLSSLSASSPSEKPRILLFSPDGKIERSAHTRSLLWRVVNAWRNESLQELQQPNAWNETCKEVVQVKTAASNFCLNDSWWWKDSVYMYDCVVF